MVFLLRIASSATFSRRSLVSPLVPDLGLRANNVSALQEQMDRLADTSLVAGERSDATDHCLAGIARLSNEVKDASSYIPTYDQRIYAEVRCCQRTP